MMNSIHSVYLLDFNKVCRTCLGTETLNPIFSGSEDEDVYSAKIFNSAGIKISSDDGLPQNMCADCVNCLNSNMKFREKCRITENELLKIKNKINISEDVGDGAEDSESGSFIEDDSEDRSTTRKKSVIVDAKSLVPKNPLELEITFGSAVKIEKLGDVKNENEDIKEFDDSSNFHSEALHIDSQGNNHGSMLGNLITSKADSQADDMKLSLDDLEISKTDAYLKLKSSNISTPNWNPSIKNSDSLIHCLIPLTDDSNSPVDDSNFLIENSNPVTDDLIRINPSKRRKKCGDINAIEDIQTIGIDKSRKRVMCKLCGKNLSVRSLNCHMLAKHPQVDSRREKCEMCEKMILKNKMEKHCEKFHGVNGEKANFLCAYCKSIFKMKEGLKEHITTCTERKKRKKGSERGRELKPCDVCGKMMQKASLRHHNAVAHSGLGPVCEHCGKRFANKIRLDEHCRAKHGYEKYKCSICDFRSSGLMAMRNHERRHRGEKPFVCETCGAKFHAAYLLTQHRQTHRKEKVVKCNLCSASFKANNSLHMHKITCHSDSTFKCYLCERIFSCRHYVVKHLRHFHSYQGKVGKIEKIEGKVLLPGRSRMEENKED